MAKKNIIEEEFKIISLEQYKTFASRTNADMGSKDLNTDHMISGIITEIGELNDIYKKELAYKKEVDVVNVIEEWADQMWYLANESLNKNYKFQPEQNYLDFFRRTLKNKTNIQLTGIESIRILNSAMFKKDYLTMYVSYLFYIAERLDINVLDALTKNILKLAKRFGSKFSEIKALNRDLEEERKVLESK